MKINILDAHDRLLEFQKEADIISRGIQECIDNVPHTIKCPFYVFAHKRTVGMDEKVSIWSQQIKLPAKERRFKRFDQIPEKRVIYCPYPRRPTPQSNSYLIRAKKGTDIVEVIWIIPEEELWGQFGKGLLCEDELICKSIEMFKNNPSQLAFDPNELSIDQVDDFRMKIKEAALAKKEVKINVTPR